MQITMKGFIWAKPAMSYDKDQTPKFSFFSGDKDSMTDYGYVTVMAHEITVEVPDDWNINKGMIEVIEKKIEKVKDEYHKQIAQLQEAAETYRALTYEPK